MADIKSAVERLIPGAARDAGGAAAETNGARFD